jgi:nicotinate-nucleotide adenylyltransferase
MHYTSIKNNYFKESTIFRSSNNMNIGIFGGSFNPPHMGHVYISLQVKQKLNLNVIVWLVTPQNPLKKNHKNYTNLEDRVDLCKKITKNYNFIKIISIEDSFNLHYSYLILRKITSLMNKSNKLFWIMGEDNLTNIDKFKNWKEIITNYDCSVFARSNSTYKSLFKKYSILNENKKLRVYLIPKNSLSSTEIRENQKLKETIIND